jgi:hypothetical protein
MKGDLRVALRIPAGRLPAYVAHAIGLVMDVDGASVVLVIAVPSADPRLPRVGTFYERLERRTLRGGEAALATVAFTAPRNVASVVALAPGAQAVALTDASPDVLIDLVDSAGPDGLPVPPAGRWRLRYAIGEDRPRDAALARPATDTSLVASALSIELDDGRTFEACRSIGSVARIGFGRTRDAIYWQTATYPARRLARLVAGVAIPGDGDVTASEAPPAPRSPAATPSTAPFLGLAKALAAKVLDRMVYRADWAVFSRRRAANDPPPRDLSGFVPVASPPGRFYADPFVIAGDERPTLYVEDCPSSAHRGRISVLTAGDDGHWGSPAVILADIEHRAYPHVIATSTGELMTPDSGRAGGVDVFRRDGAAGTWLPAHRWLDGLAVSDPTLVEHDGRLWLFVAMTGRGMNPWDELHLYSAPVVDGPWSPHPLNPVVADCRRARPAGRVFEIDGKLVRPGQDCSVSYGRRIVLNEIRTLTTTEYAEAPIATIEPEGIPDVTRTHTYSVDGPVEALDGYLRRRRFISGRSAR